MVTNKSVITFSICAIIITGIVSLISLAGDNNRSIAFAQANSKENTGIMNSANSMNDKNAVVNSLNFTSAAGNIASLQNDASGKPAWLLSGTWNLLVFKPRLEENKMKPATITFDSIFDMVNLSGAARHQHTMSISDFNLTSVNNSMTNKDHVLTTTFNGTSKISMMGSQQSNVPVSIKIMDKGTISLWVDPSKINNHFGSTPIYGIVSRKSG
jgi:hypothetical protein